MEDYTLTPERQAFRDAMDAVALRSKGNSTAETARILGSAGMLGLLVPEEKDGTGLYMADAVELVRAAGVNLLEFPLVEALLVSQLLSDSHSEIAESVMSGEMIASVAWRGSLNLSGASGDISGWSGHLSRIPQASLARWVLAPAGPQSFVILDLNAIQTRSEVGRTFDIGRSYEDLAIADLWIEEDRALRLQTVNVHAFHRAARLLRAAEMLGLAEASFAEGKERAILRKQFDKPIVAHQSVRHQLAYDHLRLTGAALNISYAAQAIDKGGEDADMACDVACADAARTCRSVIENAMQLHGALGFTWDMDLHKRLRRVRMLTQLYDGATALHAIAQRLIGQCG